MSEDSARQVSLTDKNVIFVHKHKIQHMERKTFSIKN